MLFCTILQKFKILYDDFSHWWCGFIGSNFINIWNNSREELVINLDNLSYSGNINNFNTKPDNEKHVFVKGDINDKKLIHNLFNEYNFRAVINFAAESHVDRSIHGPEAFIKTNILGTFNLLECTRDIWGNLNANHKKRFRFLHVSTDEVYGSLKKSEKQFTEQNNISQIAHIAGKGRLTGESV